MPSISINCRDPRWPLSLPVCQRVCHGWQTQFVPQDEMAVDIGSEKKLSLPVCHVFGGGGSGRRWPRPLAMLGELPWRKKMSDLASSVRPPIRSHWRAQGHVCHARGCRPLKSPTQGREYPAFLSSEPFCPDEEFLINPSAKSLGDLWRSWRISEKIRLSRQVALERSSTD